jgi:hypothetical protein
MPEVINRQLVRKGKGEKISTFPVAPGNQLNFRQTETAHLTNYIEGIA